MEKWITKDWTGRVLFGGYLFDSFLKAWDAIYENDPEPKEGSAEWLDGWFDDYYVEMFHVKQSEL